MSMKLAGKSSATFALEMVTRRSSIGCRITSRTVRLNSGNSSKNSTPLCDNEISPGCGTLPPPTNATSLMVWCGDRNGRSRNERTVFRHFARHAVYLGGFECFVQTKRRQDGGQPFCKHRFARAGRANENGVVPAGSRNFQRPLDVFLPFYIVEIKVKLVLRIEKFFTGIDHHRFEERFVFKELHHVVQVRDAIHIQVVDHAGFPRVGGGNNQPFKTFFACLYGNGQRSFDGLYSAVKAQFTHHHVLVQPVGFFNLFRCAQHTHRDGQVEGRPGFLNVGRREVHHKLGARHVIIVGFDGAFHALQAFFYGTVGQTNNEIMLTGAYVDFNGDGDGFYAINGASKCLYEHACGGFCNGKFTAFSGDGCELVYRDPATHC